MSGPSRIRARAPTPPPPTAQRLRPPEANGRSGDRTAAPRRPGAEPREALPTTVAAGGISSKPVLRSTLARHHRSPWPRGTTGDEANLDAPWTNCDLLRRFALARRMERVRRNDGHIAVRRLPEEPEKISPVRLRLERDADPATPL